MSWEQYEMYLFVRILPFGPKFVLHGSHLLQINEDDGVIGLYLTSPQPPPNDVFSWPPEGIAVEP